MDATSTIAISEIISLTQNLASTNLAYLGISVTILVLLGGGSYLFSVKPFKDKLDKQEEELQKLKKEVQDNFEKSKSNLDINLKNFQASYSEQLNKLIEQKEKNITSNFESKLITLDKNLFEKINTTSKEKDDSLKEGLISEINKKDLELENKLSTSINTYKVENDKVIALLKNKTESSLRELAMVVKELEAFKYDQEGKQGGIIKLIESLEDDIKYKDYAVKYKLDDIKDKLSKYELSPELYLTLKRLLDSIKGKEISGQKHDVVIKEIEKLITIERNPS
jgi:hypothetical protein